LKMKMIGELLAESGNVQLIKRIDRDTFYFLVFDFAPFFDGRIYWKYIPAMLAVNTNIAPNMISKLSIIRLPILCETGIGVGVGVCVDVGVTGVKVRVGGGVGSSGVLVGTSVGKSIPTSKARKKIASSALPKKTLNAKTCAPVASGALINQDH
jgi:hypothetical protein